MSALTDQRRRFYAARGALLGPLAERVGGSPNPPAVERLLNACGDLLRRRASFPDDAEAAGSVVRLIPAQGLGRWLVEASASAVDQALASVTPQLKNPPLTEAAREGAVQALAARDRLESSWAAIDAWLTHHADPAMVGARAKLGQERADLDARHATAARWLLALNALRRAERDLLDAAERKAAWWFSARADCDPTSPPHVEACPDCRWDLAEDQVPGVRRPP